MPQSLARIPVHLVFSTKDRSPVLVDDLQPRLHSYLAGILKSEGHQPIVVGGYSDHVHLLFGLSRTQTIAKTVEVVKLGSSRWLANDGLQKFYWQGGYGVFGISESNVPIVATYIQNQHIHHRSISFKEEFQRLLEEHSIDFDDRYVWD